MSQPEEPYPGATPLATAAWKGQVDKVKKLLKEGADVNKRSDFVDKGASPEAPLLLAIDKGHREVVKVLLNHGADANIRASNNSTPLINASRLNQPDIMKLLLAKGALLKGTVTGTGETALHAAVRGDAKRALKILMDYGADINVLSADGYAPLHEAAASASWTDLLVDHGADPKLENPNNGCQPLHLAARSGKADVCNLLISAGADINAASKDGLTPLHEAAQHAQAEIIEVLIAAGAACMAEDKQHKTPLSAALTTTYGPAARPAAFADDKLVATVSALLSHGAGTRKGKQAWPELAEAASAGHAAVVQLLINKGAPASSEALAAAARCGRLEVVELLLKRGAKAQAASSEQPGALHLAARYGHAQIVHLLIDHGASTTATCILPEGDHDWAGAGGQVTTPLQIALEHGHATAAEVIIKGAAKAGADISGSAEHAVDTLHRAASTGDSSMMTLLLDTVKVGADAQHGREQHAPLHVAAKAGYLGGITILLEAGASINLQNKRGHTPLFVAVTGGHFFCVQHLIKAGADPNIAATDTRTALFAAAANAIPSSLSMVDCLLETANSKQEMKDMVCARTKDDRSVLHSACASSNVDVVRRLLKAGADVNVQSKDGATPIARAAACGNMVVIKLLQKAGGTVNVRNTAGMTPLAYAASRGQAQLVSTLISMGCPVDTRNKDGTTPLHQAATAGNQEVVVTLLGRGADPKAQDKGGFMPHHDAASKGQLNTLRVLLQDKRTPINEGVHDGLTALHMAASEDKEGVIKLLIVFGADVEKRSYVDGRTALHYAARWASQNAASALLAAAASFTTVDNCGKTPLHLAVAAPVQQVDELTRQAMIKQGQRASQFLDSNNVVSVVRELLSLDYGSATVADDEGHTPLMIAADRAFESPSEVTELVMHMLQQADISATSSSVVNPPRGCSGAQPSWAEAVGRPAFGRPKPARTAWGKPAASAPRQQGQQQQQQAQAVHGNGFSNQGWSDDDEEAELHPDGDHEAQKEVDEGYPEQAQPGEDEEEVDEETLQARTDAAAAAAAADAAAQELLRQEAAEKEAAAEGAARAAVKRAKKKKRQKAAKKNGPQPLDEDNDFLDEASDPAPLLHPSADPTQLAASQYPAGVPLPGQDPLSANRKAAFQAGAQQRSPDTQGQAAAVQAKRGKAVPQQAAAQEATQPAVAADAGAKQGKMRGGKKQAQKAAEPVSQGSSETPPNLNPTYPPQASWDRTSGQLHHTEGPPMQLPPRKSQYDYQPERYEQPREHHSKLKQSHVHSHQHSQSVRQQQNADYFNGPQDHAHPDYYKHQPQAESQYPLHAQYPISSEVDAQSLSQQPSQPTGRASQPPGFPAQPPQAPAKPTPQDLHFPPLHQAVATGSNRKQSHGRADARPAQPQQQPPQQLQAQQHGDAPGRNQTYSFADLQRANQELQQLQQQQPMAGDNSRQMAQMMQMQMQMQQMMMSMMAQQQQQGVNASPALAAQPAMTPNWDQPAFPLNQALPSSFLSVNPHPAYRSDQYQSSGMQTQDRPHRRETRPSRRLIKGLTENELRSFTCPITHDIMWEPVVASDGHTYEKDAIEQWLAASPDGQALSPMTQVPMGRTVLPNKIIADLIRDKQAKV